MARNTAGGGITHPDSTLFRVGNWEVVLVERNAGGQREIGPPTPAELAAAEDADCTLRVFQVLQANLTKETALQALYRDLELPIAQVLFRIERNGVLIDAAALAQQSNEIGIKLMALESEAYALAGQPFNLNSPKQLGEILFVKQGLPVVKKTPSGGASTDEEVLEKLAEDYPLPKALLTYRSLAKLKGTYTDKLPKTINPNTGRVHTSFGQATAITGRLSSNDPNLQNIPIRTAEGRRIRSAFIAAAKQRRPWEN